MLRTADRDVMDAGETPGPAAFEPALASFPMAETATPQYRYGDRKSVNLPAILLILAIHAVLIAAIIQARHNYVRHKEEKMTVVNLMPPPPPPPSAEEPPPPAVPEVVAPAPIVQTPVPPVPQVMTSPEPPPIAMPAAPPAPRPAPPAVSAPPSTVQAGDLSAQMLSGKPPRYPIDSRRRKEQGTVVLALTLGLDGRVADIFISHSSGSSRLDNAARDAVKSWRWAPIIRNGQPVMVKGVVEIPFVLQGG